MVVAHVRRATVGIQSIENTHPFQIGRWIFAHNGTIPNFLKIRDRMIPQIDPLFRNDTKGTTDSEHIFFYLLSLHQKHPELPLMDVLGRGIRQIIGWSREVDPDCKVGLNVVLSDGDHLVGSRIGRTLWHLEREFGFECPICGKSHVHHETGSDYRAVEIASEPLSDENWLEFPEDVVYSVDEDFYLLTQSIPQ